jgi:hypothetical protein
MLRTADRIASKNSVDPRQIVEFLMKVPTDLTTPMQIDPKTGEVTFGSNKLFVDRDTLGMLAKQRGENMKASRKQAETQKVTAVSAALAPRAKSLRNEEKAADIAGAQNVTQATRDIPRNRLAKTNMDATTKSELALDALNKINAEISYYDNNSTVLSANQDKYKRLREAKIYLENMIEATRNEKR